MDTKPKRKQVRHKLIVEYWEDKISETELNIDWSDALYYCWACGYKKKLQGAHIIPHCLGGESEPSNMVLLCTKCNRENPHANSPDEYWAWLKSKHRINKGGLYNTSIVGEMIKKYNETYQEDFMITIAEIYNYDLTTFYKDLLKFGVENENKYYINNDSTRVVFYRDFVKHIKNEKAKIISLKFKKIQC